MAVDSVEIHKSLIQKCFPARLFIIDSSRKLNIYLKPQMKNMMKTPTKFIALLSGAALLSALSAQPVSTDPVGYSTITLPANGGSGESVSFVSIPLLNSAEFSGSIESLVTAEQKIVISNAAFTPSEFVTGGTYHVEITSGETTEGMIATIIANDASSITVHASEDITPSLVGGESLKVRKYRTIGDVFGSTNSAGLISGVDNNFTAADTILLPNSSGGYDTYFYNVHSTVSLFTGWRKTTALTVDAEGEVLSPTMGFLVKHKSNTPLSVVLTGEVQVNSFEIPINTGTNFLASAYPTDTTIADIFGSSNEAGLVAGADNNFSSADTILVPNPSGGYDTYFYNVHSTVSLFTGWRKTTALTVDASNTLISTGTSSMLVKRVGSGFDLVQNPNF